MKKIKVNSLNYEELYYKLYAKLKEISIRRDGYSSAMEIIQKLAERGYPLP